MDKTPDPMAQIAAALDKYAERRTHWGTVGSLKKREALLALIRSAIAPQPAQGWYCAHCQRGVEPREVTFSETHEACGRVITNDKAPQPAAAAASRSTSDAVSTRSSHDRWPR